MTEKIEQIIIAKSKGIFISQGFAGARMQAISDADGINKALRHYYYRSKEKLYVHVVQEIIEEIVKNIITIIESESDVATEEQKEKSDLKVVLLNNNILQQKLKLKELEKGKINLLNEYS